MSVGTTTPLAGTEPQIQRLYPEEEARRWGDAALRPVVSMTRSAPEWLGDFKLRMFGNYRGRSPIPPAAVVGIGQDMIGAAAQAGWELPSRGFTTIFVQLYAVGQVVRAHTDPTDNIDCTLILGLGDFDAGEHVVTLPDRTWRRTLTPGELLWLPCTRNGVRGPRHAVQPLLRGSRWAVILNAIEGVPRLDALYAPVSLNVPAGRM